MLRAGLIATSQGLKIDGIGCKTRAYYWVNAFIREFIGTLYYEKKTHNCINCHFNWHNIYDWSNIFI